MRRVAASSRLRSCSPFPCTGEKVQVRSRSGVPVRLEWQERIWPILSVESSWCASGRWWLDSTRYGEKRRYFRVHVQTPNRGTLCLELFHTKERDAPTSQWHVWRIAD